MNIGVTIGVPPPAPVYEAVAWPATGLRLVAGLLALMDGGRHVWSPGYWIELSVAAITWVPDRWAHVDHGWHHETRPLGSLNSDHHRLMVMGDVGRGKRGVVAPLFFWVHISAGWRYQCCDPRGGRACCGTKEERPMPAPIAIRLHPNDNVVVARMDILAGTEVEGEVVAPRAYHLYNPDPRDEEGEPLRKYNQIIGFATDDLAPGTHIHTHNCAMGDFERDYAFCADAHPTDFIRPGSAPRSRAIAVPTGGPPRATISASSRR